MSALLEAEGIRRSYRGSLDMEVPSLTVDRGQVLGILGPSGAGKSTLLRILALLEEPDSGVVRIEGRRVSTRSLTARRRMAAALQSPPVFRGTVTSNVEFGLRLRGMDPSERRRRATRALSEVGLAGMEGRRSSEISGGEAQRVGLARALVTDPDILFLDEPLAHIDEPQRESLAVYLRDHVRRSGCATVWVTHDRSEALSISDRIALLDRNRLIQSGSALEVFSRPADEHAARLVGADNVIAGTVSGQSGGLASVKTQGSTFEAMSEISAGTEVYLLVRPEDVSIWTTEPSSSSPRNRVEGDIAGVVALGPTVKVTIRSSPPLVALITRPSYEELGLSVGSRIGAGFKATAAHVVRRA